MPTRIVIADDHEMMRDGLKRLLAEQPDFEVVGEAGNGRAALQLARELTPQVVVMDVRMPDLNGVDATRQIISAVPAVKVICLSAHADERTAAETLRAGANAFVVKASAFTELLAAIQRVLKGDVYISPAIASSAVIDHLRPQANVAGPLSSREREVLQLLAEGKSMKEVAAHLDVSVKTIETHRRNIMDKLELNSVAELTKYAVREGISSL